MPTHFFAALTISHSSCTTQARELADLHVGYKLLIYLDFVIFPQLTIRLINVLIYLTVTAEF